MKNEPQNNKITVTDFFGNGYVRIPRKMIEAIFSHDVRTRHFYRIYCALFTFSAFKNHPEKENKLKTGELIISVRELAEITDIPRTSVHRFLKELEKKGLIKTAYHRDGQLIQVMYYKEITEKYARLSSTHSRQHFADKNTKPIGTAKEKWEKEQTEREEETKRANREILNAIYSNKNK